MDKEWVHAFNDGCTKSLTYLLETYGAQVLYQHIRAPFICALQSPNSSGLIRVLSRHSEVTLGVDLPDETGKSALWVAIGQERPLDVAALLRAGANPNQRNPKGWLPSWFLAWQGQAALLESVVAFGGQLSDPTQTDRCLLGLAIESASLPTFGFLLPQPEVDVFGPLANGKDLLDAVRHLPQAWADALEQERRRRRARDRQLAWQDSFPAAGCATTPSARL